MKQESIVLVQSNVAQLFVKNSIRNDILYTTYPGGEILLPYIQKYGNEATIKFLPRNSNDIMALTMLKDLLDRQGLNKITLDLLYTPYARQDRVKDVDGNQYLGIKVFADIINNLNFDQVSIYDPHSNVTPALFNNAIEIKRVDLLEKIIKNIIDKNKGNVVLIAPDAGAYKDTIDIASKFDIETVVMCQKIRDMATGKIKGTHIYEIDKLENKDVLIVDDICDGGATFIGIAEAITVPVKSKSLVVTHGIFSKGKALLEKYFDNVEAYNYF